MTKYVANPVIVDAWEIVEIHNFPCHPYEEVEYIYKVVLNNREEYELTYNIVARYEPMIGDYFVIQEDGYEYINPKSVFERKYRKVEE